MGSYTGWDRFKTQVKSFFGDATGKMLIFLLAIGVVAVLALFAALSLF